MLDADAKEKMELSLYRKSSNRSLASGSVTSKDAGLSSGGSMISDKPRNGYREDRDGMPRGIGNHASRTTVLWLEEGRFNLSLNGHIGQKPSSDKHQWWNDPLEEGVKRIPSNNRNPFEGDQTILDRGVAQPPLSRPAAPHTPTTKPEVDPFGGNRSCYRPNRALVCFFDMLLTEPCLKSIRSCE